VSDPADSAEAALGPELDDQLCEIVRDWVRRSCPRMLDGKTDSATLTIVLREPGWDTDDTPMLDARIEETSTVSDIGGRVTDKKGTP
jgi:hypothetical protein